MKKYICIATVTVKAPANYRPRTSTYKLACYADKAGLRAKDVEQEALRHVKKCLADANPGLDLKFSVSSKTETIFGIRTYENLKGGDFNPIGGEENKTTEEK